MGKIFDHFDGGEIASGEETVFGDSSLCQG